MDQGFDKCPECLDTPCTCGQMYEDWSTEKIVNHLMNIISEKSTQEKVDVIEQINERLNDVLLEDVPAWLKPTMREIFEKLDK